MTTARAMLLALLLGTGCDGSPPPPSDAGRDAGSVGVDAGPADAGSPDAGPPRDTWASFAQGFFATYCNDCHSTSPKDFRLLSDVRANAAVVRCGVSDVALADCGSWPPPRQFPIGTGPRPSDEERSRLVAWIDDGMPE